MEWALSCTASTASQSQENTSYQGTMTPLRRPAMYFHGATALRHQLTVVWVILNSRTRRSTPSRPLATPSPPCTATSVRLTIMTFLRRLAPSIRSPGHLIKITMPWRLPALNPRVHLLQGLLNLARGLRGNGGVRSRWEARMERWRLQCRSSHAEIPSPLLRTSGFTEVCWHQSVLLNAVCFFKHWFNWLTDERKRNYTLHLFPNAKSDSISPPSHGTAISLRLSLLSLVLSSSISQFTDLTLAAEQKQRTQSSRHCSVETLMKFKPYSLLQNASFQADKQFKKKKKKNTQTMHGFLVCRVRCFALPSLCSGLK